MSLMSIEICGSDDSSNLHLYNIRAVVEMACGLVKAAAKQF